MARSSEQCAPFGSAFRQSHRAHLFCFCFYSINKCLQLSQMFAQMLVINPNFFTNMYTALCVCKYLCTYFVEIFWQYLLIFTNMNKYKNVHKYVHKYLHKYCDCKYLCTHFIFFKNICTNVPGVVVDEGILKDVGLMVDMWVLINVVNMDDDHWTWWMWCGSCVGQ